MASFKGTILVWLTLFLVFENAKGVSKEEYEDMKRYLNTVNKPAIKSFKKNGDIFDCVDIYKQHAFDHPLLKNHTLQTRFNSNPIGRESKDEAGFDDLEIKIGLPDGGCPQGSVPIRRIKMEDLIRAKEARLYGKKYPVTVMANASSANASSLLAPSNHRYAVNKVTHVVSYGTKVTMNVWNPDVINGQQFSLAQLWLTNGPYKEANTIEVGWMVNPGHYGDLQTRLFTYWTPDGYRHGCYDTTCSGFVHVNKEIPLGDKLEPVSIFEGMQQTITIKVYKDPSTSNWVLTWGKNDTVVGYWPSTLFTHLRENAGRIDWGGETWSTPGTIFAGMGSGHFPSEGKFGISCYMRNIMLVDATHNLVDIPINSYCHSSTPQCYVVDFCNNPVNSTWGRSFYFGGPGGYNC